MGGAFPGWVVFPKDLGFDGPKAATVGPTCLGLASKPPVTKGGRDNSLSMVLAFTASPLFPFFWAGIENSDILRALLEVIHDKQLAAQANDRGDTPLHVAARAGRIHRIRMAELLLDCSSIVDEANEAGNTALHEAVKNGDYELTDLLLRRGSKSANKKNKENKFARMKNQAPSFYCSRTELFYLALVESLERGHFREYILLRLLQAVDGNEVLPTGYAND
ncbi:hypothetical protein NL676_020948 [Syzygium grande]|nr:hypothetical protein NL676_020948 [Syzygium grande]